MEEPLPTTVPAPEPEAEKVPGSLLYCRIINGINIVLFILSGLAVMLIMIPFLLIPAASGNMPPKEIIAVILFLVALVVWLPAWRLLKLNRELKNREPRARKWQAFWSTLFFWSFPFGTVLHGIALCFMLFGRKTRKALTNDAGDTGSAVAGVTMAMPVIVITAMLAFWSASMAVHLEDLPTEMPMPAQLQQLLSGKKNNQQPVMPQSSPSVIRQAVQLIEFKGSTEILLKNGNTVKGDLVEETAEYVTISITGAGDMTFSRDEIESVGGAEEKGQDAA